MSGNLTIIGYALAAAASAFGIAIIFKEALSSIARQPEVQGQIRTLALIGMAAVEALALFAFVLMFVL